MKQFFILMFVLCATSSISQNYSKLNKDWVAMADSAENLLCSQDTIIFRLYDYIHPNWCVYHLSLSLIDSTDYIRPQMWCSRKNWHKHPSFSPRGTFHYLNEKQLMWEIDNWECELKTPCYGKLYFSFILEEKKLTLIRNKNHKE